jgi:HK97 family phage major capsid protein
MTSLIKAVPETKGTDDIATAFDTFMTSFEEWRETNERRLDEIDRRSADVLTEEKLARIDRALDTQKSRLDRLSSKADRPSLGAGAARPVVDLEHRAAFDAYVRSGADAGLRQIEAKAMSSGAGADGGYTVTAEIDAEIGRRLPALSPIRSIAAVRTVSSGTFKKPYQLTGPAVGWVGETAPRPETASPQLGELTFPTMELYAMPSATQSLLDDSAVDLETWLAEEIELAFALQEGGAFVNGDGVTRPKGFLDVPAVDESVWSWGSLGTVPSGAAGAFAALHGSDALVDLVYALKPGYRQNAAFVMNRRTQAAVRKLKDAAGNYLWQPPLTPDGRASLMGFPLTEVESMPDMAPDATAIAFGDFRRGYLVVDRMGTRVLRDPYSAKPYVLFYVTRRVGGGVQDFDAIKLMTFGTA